MEFKIEQITFEDFENNLDKAEQIKVNKYLSQIKEKIFKEFVKDRGDYCFNCKKNRNGHKNNKEKFKICDSHTLPQSILKNITMDKHMYYYSKSILETYEKKSGISNAGIFKLICTECDSSIFKQYENEIQNYGIKLSNEALKQIEMKNVLKMIYENKLEYIGYKKHLEYLGSCMNVNLINDIKDAYVKKEEYRKQIDKFEKRYDYLKKGEVEYRVLYEEELPYIIPVAFQTTLGLIVDFDGNYINKPFPLEDYKNSEFFYFCGFPFKDKESKNIKKSGSKIIIFEDINNKRYEAFFDRLKKFEKNEQLAILNYILFVYSEEYFISKGISKEVLQRLKPLVNTTPDLKIYNKVPEEKIRQEYAKIYDYLNYSEYPNLLSKEYGI